MREKVIFRRAGLPALTIAPYLHHRQTLSNCRLSTQIPRYVFSLSEDFQRVRSLGFWARLIYSTKNRRRLNLDNAETLLLWREATLLFLLITAIILQSCVFARLHYYMVI
jgi:hypothetical protein